MSLSSDSTSFMDSQNFVYTMCGVGLVLGLAIFFAAFKLKKRLDGKAKNIRDLLSTSALNNNLITRNDQEAIDADAERRRRAQAAKGGPSKSKNTPVSNSGASSSRNTPASGPISVNLSVNTPPTAADPPAANRGPAATAAANKGASTPESMIQAAVAAAVGAAVRNNNPNSPNAGGRPAAAPAAGPNGRFSGAAVPTGRPQSTQMQNAGPAGSSRPQSMTFTQRPAQPVSNQSGYFPPSAAAPNRPVSMVGSNRASLPPYTSLPQQMQQQRQSQQMQMSPQQQQRASQQKQAPPQQMQMQQMGNYPQPNQMPDYDNHPAGQSQNPNMQWPIGSPQMMAHLANPACPSPSSPTTTMPSNTNSGTSSPGITHIHIHNPTAAAPATVPTPPPTDRDDDDQSVASEVSATPSSRNGKKKIQLKRSANHMRESFVSLPPSGEEQRVTVGEWSAAVNDCDAPFIHQSQSFPNNEKPHFDKCEEYHWKDPGQRWPREDGATADDHPQKLKSIINAQLAAYERGAGWFFWTAKTEGVLYTSHQWDYLWLYRHDQRFMENVPKENQRC
ncbi:hypothetical protein HDU86_008418 [Geranomyces michiganensis]|nr:hypothetical protein HDU86_008418 [Geranomyces michiganensis]